MTILALLATYWKVVIGLIAGLAVAVFGLKYQRRKYQVLDLKRENTALKAKEETGRIVQGIEQKKNEKIGEVKSAPKDALAGRLNDLPK